VHDYRVALFRDHTFSYDIAEDGKTTRYIGEYTGAVDTIFLRFRPAPPAISSYLVKEISGGYLIQTFPSIAKRIFLRKQLLPWQMR
jgi:hypothetical protein